MICLQHIYKYKQIDKYNISVKFPEQRKLKKKKKKSTGILS